MISQCYRPVRKTSGCANIFVAKSSLYGLQTNRDCTADLVGQLNGKGQTEMLQIEPIEMRFGAQIRVNPMNCSVDGGPDRSREETCMTGLCADTLWTADSSLRSRWSQPVPRSRGVTQQQCVLSPPLLWPCLKYCKSTLTAKFMYM